MAILQQLREAVTTSGRDRPPSYTSARTGTGSGKRADGTYAVDMGEDEEPNEAFEREQQQVS